MSQMYMLTVLVPHDEIGFPKVQKLLETKSYKKTYLKGIVPPNKIEYVMGPYSQIGIDNAVIVFDNEPRNKEIHMRMEKIINSKHKICIWPSYINEKDINDMVLNGIHDVESIIKKNTFKGLEAELQFKTWRKR